MSAKGFLVSVLFVLSLASAATTVSAQIQFDSLSVEETAKELANPTNPLGRVTVQLKRWAFADNQENSSRTSGHSLVLESSIPFAVGNGGVIRFRPTVPVYLDYPVVHPHSQEIRYRSGLADINFDLAYGRKYRSGVLFAFGVAATLPTATNDWFGNDRFTLGPEILFAIQPKWGVIGVFPSHEWKITGAGSFSRTVIQPLVTLLPGNGWSVGSSPSLSYDWIGNKWNVPWILSLGKTAKFASSTWSFSADISFYGKQDDAVAPEWMIGANVTRVVGYWLGALSK